MIDDFRQLGLSEESIQALQAKGFEEPTEIQKQCIPLLLKEKMDVIGQAMTGTGKTAAFGLPILEMINPNNKDVQALVLTPTRELCVQVSDEINSLAGARHIEIAPIYGGSSMEAQLRQLRRGVDVVVGTPGRILDHLQRGTLDISHIKCFILDEADEMLDMGFIEDIESILEQAPPEKRMLCFSATMPEPILKLASRFMPDYKLVRTQTEDLTSSLTEQLYYETRECDKLEVLMRVIEITEDFYGLVFCRTKIQCDEIGAKLIDRGYNAEVLHGDLSQKQRELIIHKMREHMISILVATDVAARGIDLPDLTHVINYSIPQDPETYIHRVGRTGRAGQHGLAITFVNSSEFRKFAFMKRMAKSEITKAQVPTIDQIKKAKQLKIKEKLTQALDKPVENSRFDDLAQEILAEHDSRKALAAILQISFERDLDTSRFHQIRDLYNGPDNPRVDTDKRNKRKSNASTRIRRQEDYEGTPDVVDSDFRDIYEEEAPRRRSRREEASFAGLDDQGFTRLFIAKGERDGLNRRDLVQFIMDKTGAHNQDIQKVEVHDDFSFISAPYQVADSILKTFSDDSPSGRPLVTRAHDDEPSPRPRKRYSDEGRAPRRREERPRYDRGSDRPRRSGRGISEEEMEFLRYSVSHDAQKRSPRKIKGSKSSKKRK